MVHRVEQLQGSGKVNPAIEKSRLKTAQIWHWRPLDDEDNSRAQTQ